MQHPEVSLVLRRIVVANVEGGQLTSRFFLFVVLKTSIKLFKTERKKKAEKERERESGFVSVVAYVFQPSVRDAFRRDRSIDRTNDNDNYTQVSSSSRAMTRRRRRRKKEKTTSLLFYAKVVDKKNDVSQGVLRRCSTRKRRDTRTQIFSLAHFAAARCGLSLFTSWYARFTSSYFLSNASFFLSQSCQKTNFSKRKRKEVFINTTTHARNSFSSLEKRNTRGLGKRARTERKRVRSLRQRRTNKELLNTRPRKEMEGHTTAEQENRKLWDIFLTHHSEYF